MPRTILIRGTPADIAAKVSDVIEDNELRDRLVKTVRGSSKVFVAAHGRANVHDLQRSAG